jgi:hypothetical protein
MLTYICIPAAMQKRTQRRASPLMLEIGKSSLDAMIQKILLLLLFIRA